MESSGLQIEVRHATQLCFAMQQSAVPWLDEVALCNQCSSATPSLRVRIELVGFAEPVEVLLDSLPAGERLALEFDEPLLRAAAFAELEERLRTELRVEVWSFDGDDDAGDAPREPLSRCVRAVDVLAYNEWPGLAMQPPLLAAFVLPNHPALTGLLHTMAERLRERTGSDALDGYQAGDPARVRAMVASAHDAVVASGIRYIAAPPSFERHHGQKVRLPEQLVGERLGTCLDLTLLYAALLERCGLDPFVVLLRGHALVGVWLREPIDAEARLGSLLELRKGQAAGLLVLAETTVACLQPPQPFERAEAAARHRLDDEDAFVLALDVAAARRQGYRPLPMRDGGYRAIAEPVSLSEAGGAVAAALAPLARTTNDGDGGEGDDAGQEPAPLFGAPRDRLEHWQQKLLDLTMFNRLLNFVETKKTIRLCAHDLGALEDELQSGASLRVQPRVDLGRDGGEAADAGDPRDLSLRQQRSGEDLVAGFLADELRRGRLRAEFDREPLDERLTGIFRHARTSIEESGANTLYLALGFLRWFESDSSTRPRLAPLLLVPLVIERLSVQEGYRFVMDDAEVRVNTTLLQLLDRDFDLRVALDETLPEDERGVDVDAVLAAFRDVALKMPRWEVEVAASIGFFSFTKLLMYRDLHHRDELLQSPVLRHLVEAPGAALPQDVPEVPREELDDLDPAEVFCPKDADSSQLAAVVAGSRGRSFVLEGPPGTGKSQTITNLIAQSLASGRRVLFVAEKRAALEVVHTRLSDVGLGPFCLELHSQKSGPKAVLEQLRATLELGRRRPPAGWQQLADRLQQERDGLNRFVRELHRAREHGWSVHDAMARLIGLREAPRFELPDLPVRDAVRVAAAREGVAQLVVAAGRFGVPCESDWWGVQRSDWTPAVTRDVGPRVARLRDATAALAAAIAPVVDGLGLGEHFAAAGPSQAQLDALLELVQALRAPSLPPVEWLSLAEWRAFDRDLERAVAIGLRRDELWSQLAPRWRRELLDLDLGGLAASYRMHAESFWLFRWWRLRRQRPVLAAVALTAPGAATAIRDDLELALRVGDEQRELDGCTVVRDVLGPAWRDGRLDWRQHGGWLEQVRGLRRLVLRLAPDALEPDARVLAAIASRIGALSEGVVAGWAEPVAALLAAHDEFAAAVADLGRMLDLDACSAFGAADEAGYLRRVGDRVGRWFERPAGLRDQCAYRRAVVAAEQAGLRGLVDAHAIGELPLVGLRDAFERSLQEAWLDDVHREEPQLARFRGQDHEAAIARFAELDRESIRLGAEVVVARLCAQLPQLRDTNVASSELGVLERELKKQRRHKPVRRLLREIRGLWPRLSPCVLMSPLSVAQYLGRDAQRFDLVVFDEASQIPMWDAVGAIGRGQSLIVVGDSRQLPPTSFFQRVEPDEERDVEGVPEDLESVLDECGAAGLPRMHLDWHYRSRHESLIAFSNHHYYQNRLLTFPSPQAAGPGTGVRCVRVDGVYDRAGSQQNRIEAEALVREVVVRLRDPALRRQSLGVVTFSRSQQTLIEDLIDAERRADATLEQALLEADEELFVKNLENVQGDERDVILFSICYGPDAAGKVYENYGPLNLQGGERRLNVAVTRARHELVVFCSIGPEQVANRSAAVGAKHLRNFLDYAVRGEAALAAVVEHDPSRDVDSPFEASVRDALQQRGYEVHTQVGCSGYRIDLAVVDPDAGGRYLLGVECDGATYHSAATARDRDRLREAVLRGLGWQLVRIWSTDYWQDPRAEIDRVEAAIEAARDDWARRDARVKAQAAAHAVCEERHRPDVAAADEVAADDVAVAEPVVAEVAAIDPEGPRPYRCWHPESRSPEAASGDLAGDRRLAASLLEVEAPIVFDRFVRLLGDAWGASRVTERVRRRARAALPDAVVQRGAVLWRDGEHEAMFRGFREPVADGASERDAVELPAVEAANAVRWILRQHHALDAEDLLREAARCFGIQRLGSVVRGVMQRALDEVLESGAALCDGDRVRLVDADRRA